MCRFYRRTEAAPCPSKPGEARGFTLLELTAGLAVISLLVLGVLGAVARFTDMQERLGVTTRERHRRAVLARLLWEDLNHQPVGEPSPEGTSRRFERTTVSYESDRMLRLDTRVRYDVRQRGGERRLIRRWRWVDLQEDYRGAETLIRSDRLRFSYRGRDGRWVSDTRDVEQLTALRLIWGEGPRERVVVPVMRDAARGSEGDTPTL